MEELCVNQPHPNTCLVDSSETNLCVMGLSDLRNFRPTASAESSLAKIITVVEMLAVGIRDSNKTGLVLVILHLCLDTEATEGSVGLLV
jgi:hypothetical protein